MFKLVTFTEEILNGKLHFLYNKISLIRGYHKPKVATTER